MKNIALLFALCIGVAVSGQDSKLSNLPVDGTLSGSESIYSIESGASYQMSSELYLDAAGDSAAVVQGALEDTASDLRTAIADVSAGEYWEVYTFGGKYDLYPKVSGTYAGVTIGINPNSSTVDYHLYIHSNKPSYFGGDVLMNDTLFFNSSSFSPRNYIVESGQELMFGDFYNQDKSLADLLALPTSLSANWTLDANTYNVSMLDNNSNGYYTSYALGQTYINAVDKIILNAPITEVDTIQVDKEITIASNDTASEVTGTIYVDSDDNNLYYWNGSAWDTLNGGTGQQVSNFNAGLFYLFDGVDNTKHLDFDVSSITTGNTRTITMSDRDLDLNNIYMDASENSGIGPNIFNSITSGTQNAAQGSWVLTDNTSGSYNVGLAPFSLRGNTIGSNNIGIGYFSGRNAVSLSDRLYIGSLNRTNLAGDTTLSIIYGLQAAATADQELYLNANVHFSDSLELNGEKIGDWDDIAGGVNSPALASRDTLYAKMYNATADSFYWAPSVIDTLVENTYEITTIATSGHTLTLADAGKLLVYTYSGGGMSVTVPTNSSVAFQIGTRIRISIASSSGNCVPASPGVTINYPAGKNAIDDGGTGEFIKIGTDEWMLTGDLVIDS